MVHFVVFDLISFPIFFTRMTALSSTCISCTQATSCLWWSSPCSAMQSSKGDQAKYDKPTATSAQRRYNRHQQCYMTSTGSLRPRVILPVIGLRADSSTITTPITCDLNSNQQMACNKHCLILMILTNSIWIWIKLVSQNTNTLFFVLLPAW